MVWSFRWCPLGDALSASLARSALLTRVPPSSTSSKSTWARNDSFVGLAGIGATTFSSPVAGNVELKDGSVMDQPIDCGRGRHRVLEDPFPVAEHQVTGNQHRAPLIAFRD